jgi:polyhydroxybutyrate depolymerase
MRLNRLLLSAITAVAVLLAACGGSSEEATGSDRPPTTAAGTEPVDAGDDDIDDVPARPSPGCADPRPDEVVDEHVDLDVDGTPRSFLLTAPGAAREEPLPLVVDLHGLMEGAQIHSAHSGLGEYGLGEGFISVFPQGTGDPLRWDLGTGDQNADVAYIDAVLDHVGETRCVDEARVYATGLSNGAMMTSVLTCERADRFAAVAPVGGITAPEPCEQARPVPIRTTHGTVDPILLFNGGIGDLSSFLGDDAAPESPTTTAATDLNGDGYPATVAEWADRNGCEGAPDDERVGNSVLHRTYDCPEGADVEFYIVEGGGHTWPGSEFSRNIESITGPTTFEIDWNELAWEFFQRFALED